MRVFKPLNLVEVGSLQFSMGADRNGKATVSMINADGSEVAMVSAPAITMWPRCTGDGNFGTMWGPQDVTKAKFTLDLTDSPINETPNEDFNTFRTLMDSIDERLLDFATENQLRLLGRKNLSRDEVKMLQIRTIRPKYDKMSGALTGHSINLSTPKYAWDGMGGKYARSVTVCDCKGNAIPEGQVAPGDVVAATVFANQVYTGVGGDKFGIHWSFQDVAVICQRANLEVKTHVQAFTGESWGMAKPYVNQVSQIGLEDQFLNEV